MTDSFSSAQLYERRTGPLVLTNVVRLQPHSETKEDDAARLYDGTDVLVFVVTPSLLFESVDLKKPTQQSRSFPIASRPPLGNQKYETEETQKSRHRDNIQVVHAHSYYWTIAFFFTLRTRTFDWRYEYN